MKGLLRWLGRVIGSAVTIVLAVVLLPYASRLAARLLPDESGAAIRVSAVLASKFEETARLETFTVEDEGVLNYDIQAALLGSVANISIQYTYEASFGIDLQKVQMRAEGNKLTLVLPEPEVLQDALRPTEVQRDDFWYPGFSDADYEKLLEDERLARREAHLSDDREAMRQAAVSALDKTLSAWLNGLDSGISVDYVMADETQE